MSVVGLRRDSYVEARSGRSVGPVANGAAMRARYGTADGEAEPSAVVLGGKERVENPLDGVRRQPRAVVAHHEPHRIAVYQRRTDSDPRRASRLRAECLDAVAQEVENHLLDLTGVRRH